MKSSLYQQIDEGLSRTLKLQILELEIIGDEIAHEWLDDILDDPQRSKEEYLQVWSLNSNETLRSPALSSQDLPQLGNIPYEYVYGDYLLDGEKKLRVVGAQIFPSVDDEVPTQMKPEDYPFIMTVARETRETDETLSRLFFTLLVGQVFAIVVSFTVVVLVTRKSLQPIYQLEREVNRVDVNSPTISLAVPERFPSELNGLVARYSDLFDRIAKVRRRERDFATNAAHELRTPISGISAILEQALTKPRDLSDYQRRISEALDITVHIRELINTLMAFARLQNGSEPIRIESVSIQSSLEKCIDQLTEALQGRELKLKCEFDMKDSAVKTDQTLVGILFGNLLGNAAAYANVGSSIQIITRHQDSNIEVEIINQASGITEADLKRICEPFYRQDTARTAGEDHYGIGLALCREVCTKLNLCLDFSLKAENLFSVKVIFLKHRHPIGMS
jgi:signal transduction histidine kinase